MNSLPLSWIVNCGARHGVSDLEIESASTVWIALADLKRDRCGKLIRRGKVKEIEYSHNNAELLQNFKKESTHGNEPELLYLFQSEFKDAERLFVFENEKGEWLGGLLVSRNHERKIHLELLLRQREAPVGVMEALIYGTFEKLKETDARYFSLGEVPFVFFENHKTLSKAKLISFGGRMIRFAYNYKGLYHFKNKFNPLWKIVYLGGYPKVKFRHLKLLFTKSRLQDLALYKIKEQIF